MKILAEKILTIFKCKQRIKSNDKYEYVKKNPLLLISIFIFTQSFLIKATDAG